MVKYLFTTVSFDYTINIHGVCKVIINKMKFKVGLLDSKLKLKFSNCRFWYREWIFGLGYSCTFFTFFFYTNISVSALSMALVAVNR
jgi:hypothetical protein